MTETKPTPPAKPKGKAKKAASGAQLAVNDILRTVVAKSTERAIARAAAEIAEICREEVFRALSEAVPGAAAALVAAARGQPVALPFAVGAQQAPPPVPAGAPAVTQAVAPDVPIPATVEIDGKVQRINVKGASDPTRGTPNIATVNKGVPTVRGRVMDGIAPFRG